ncbi:MAG: response regulator [Candidatus Omnitrophica bacterium]|nr:response regulator [Candidatus Omnitrophota bacterium]
MTKPSLLSVQEVLKILNVSRRTIYYWIKKGILKPIRLGGLYRFHPEDIEALITEQRSQARPKKRILAIDDDLLVRESLKMFLEREGIETTVVSGGREALELLSKEVFDLILVDVRMPEMNGIETLKAIRELRRRFGKPPLPEIVLTAYDDELVKKEAKKLGVRDFILKPFELNSFLSTLRKNLE